MAAFQDSVVLFLFMNAHVRAPHHERFFGHSISAALHYSVSLCHLSLVAFTARVSSSPRTCIYRERRRQFSQLRFKNRKYSRKHAEPTVVRGYCWEVTFVYTCKPFTNGQAQSCYTFCSVGFLSTHWEFVTFKLQDTEMAQSKGLSFMEVSKREFHLEVQWAPNRYISSNRTDLL